MHYTVIIIQSKLQVAVICSSQGEQGQGAVINLKVKKVKNATKHATESGKLVIYKVWEHKTNGVFGSANLVAPLSLHELLHNYISSHRPQPMAHFLIRC